MQILKVLERAQNIDRDTIFRVVFEDKEVQDFIITAITDDQLFLRGEDGKGDSLGEYAPSTKDKKRFQGLPFDWITLFDEGDYYRSHVVKPFLGYIEISADSQKEDTDLVKEYGRDILRLNDENTNELIQMVIPKINKVALEYILCGVLQKL